MSNELLFSLAYFSRNAIKGSPEVLRGQVEQILQSARRNNAAHGVTGALLFSEGCFAQVLEGPREQVEAIFETIQCDPRHSDVTVMHLHPVDERSFASWSMAFGGIEGVSSGPNIRSDGMSCADSILTTVAGRNLLKELHSIVHRDDIARLGAIGTHV
jgi:hypothetical protein